MKALWEKGKENGEANKYIEKGRKNRIEYYKKKEERERTEKKKRRKRRKT